ncbi:hypothetical protein H5410_042232 [Solanum commersonii]|uniref:Uncharacterized protein n=1 Tax=Solanum commersonii TaxID=4109 RepID=A0A9J5XXX4_SOLCO|nr:hypothetical protein H5410_042232 [Solanum commersonii]
MSEEIRLTSSVNTTELISRKIKSELSLIMISWMSFNSGDINDDVTHRIGAAWMKWRLSNGQSRTFILENASCENEDVQMDVKAIRRWFGCTDALVMRCAELDIGGTMRARSRQKTYWREMISQDKAELHVTKHMTLDMRVWRSHIRVQS